MSFAKLLQSKIETLSGFNGKAYVFWVAQDKALTTEQIPFLTQHLQIQPENLCIYPDHNHFLAEEMPEKLSQAILELSH